MTPQVDTPLRPAQPVRAAWKNRLWAVPCVLAFIIGAMALRGVTANNVVDTDAARHAMNGVFIRDLVASGELRHPIQYGKSYYAHLPALSMPYHPPLFPAIESVFYWVLGVNLLAARLAVAVAVAASVWLLYRLILATCGSHVLAVCVVLTFFSWSKSKYLAEDVRPEFPALAFCLAALYCLRNLQAGYPLRRGLAFALFAGAAVWTRQQAVFLGLVPFAYVLFARQWRLLAGKTIWISSLLFGAQVIVLSLLSLPFSGTGVDQASPADTNAIAYIFTHNLAYYTGQITRWVGIVPVTLLLAAFCAYLFLRRRQTPSVDIPLHAAWAISAILILLFIGPFEGRYLFFAIPALLVLAYASVLGILSLLLPAWTPYAACLFAVGTFIVGSQRPATFMRGPAQVAAAALSGSPTRVLYCGETTGSFVFAVRALEGRVGTVVIPGYKLPAETYGHEAIQHFAKRYGVRYVVLEKSAFQQPWDRLYDSPPATMAFVRDVPLSSSEPQWNGSLRLYRFLDPSPNPENRLSIPIPAIGGSLDFEF